MKKEVIIDMEDHATFRMIERGMQFNLSYPEIERRTYETVKTKNRAKHKHQSQKHQTYCKYFNDNLTFYVICDKEENLTKIKITIKTLIIERGRE